MKQQPGDNLWSRDRLVPKESVEPQVKSGVKNDPPSLQIDTKQM